MEVGDSTSTSFHCSASILRLPEEIFQEIFLYLVDIDLPQIYESGQVHRCGWLTCLWVCHTMRAILYGDYRLWGRAYTQLPPILGTVRALARSCNLYYRVTESWPEVLYHGSPELDPITYYDKQLRGLLELADIRSCVVVEATIRWDGIAHLIRLSKCSPLPRLQVLDITHDCYKFDEDVNNQQSVTKSNLIPSVLIPLCLG